ncbi:MAG: sensor histidine kinase, partial [Verrucomicrobia bacterium]
AYLETLRHESERLSHLVENVLSYARLERGRAARRIETTTAAGLVDAMEPRLRQRAEQAGMRLRLELPPEVAGASIRTDLTAVEQIVFNLVDNAAKYARRPDRAGTITLSVARGNAADRLALRVADDGPGLSPGVRRRLFQPFSKSAAEAADSQPGVGLGLALCRRLARQELRGDLVLEKSDASGTTFRLDMRSQ